MSTVINSRIPDTLVMAGFTSEALAKRILDQMQLPLENLVKVKHKKHEDREIGPAIDDNVRGRDVIFVASAAGDPNMQFTETLFLLNSLRGASAGRISLVLPYQFYGRSDSTWGERKPIGLSAVIRTLRDYCDDVIVVDPHNAQLTRSEFTNGNRINSYSNVHLAYPFAVQLKELFKAAAISPEKLLFVHPDAGSVKRIDPDFRAALYNTLGISEDPNRDNWPQMPKDRDKGSGKVQMKDVNFNVKGRDVVIFEDMIASGGTACAIAERLKSMGARTVTLFATSGLFTPKKGEEMDASIQRIENSKLDAVFIANTYEHSKTSTKITRAVRDSAKIHTIDVSGYLAAIIEATVMPVIPGMSRTENSVSALLRGQHPRQLDQDNPMVVATSLKEKCPLALQAA